MKNGYPFFKELLAAEMGKTKIKMKNPVYLGQTIFDWHKTLMYEFYYDHILPKYKSKVKLRCMNTSSFVYEIETDDFYKDIGKDVTMRFDTNEYSKDENRALSKGKNKKVWGMMKDKLGAKIIAEFFPLRVKMYVTES